MVFDLDPERAGPWSRVVERAQQIWSLLYVMGLESFVKTTGGKGLHVVVPITRSYDWPTVKAFAKRIAESMAGDAPERFLTKVSKAERKGRIFIDYLRNDPTSTAPLRLTRRGQKLVHQ